MKVCMNSVSEDRKELEAALNVFESDLEEIIGTLCKKAADMVLAKANAMADQKAAEAGDDSIPNEDFNKAVAYMADGIMYFISNNTPVPSVRVKDGFWEQLDIAISDYSCEGGKWHWELVGNDHYKKLQLGCWTEEMP